jgi:cytoskeletal protein CcmA (bactofilin family)
MAKQQHDTTKIAYGVRVEGTLASKGDLHIEGDVEGTISAEGHLIVGEKAHLRADIEVASAHVSGELRGNMAAHGKLDLTESAKIVGDVIADSISIAHGAQLNGNVQIGTGGSAKPAGNMHVESDEA